MKRDTIPSTYEVALMIGELWAMGRRLTDSRPAYHETNAKQLNMSIQIVREGIAKRLWANTPPETVRDILLLTAEICCNSGLSKLPDWLDTSHAKWMLEVTQGWIDAGKPTTPNFSPPYAYASSVAFDRNEDTETLDTVAVLLTIAHLVPLGFRILPGE